MIIFLLPNKGLAQQQAGWFFLSHTQQINQRWDILFDAQVRSTDKYKFINTVLLRSGLNYHINTKNSVALGYVSKNDWEHTDNKISFQNEHRVYEQYLFAGHLAKIEVTVRGRLEQRFVREAESYLFSQRGRAFLAFQIPVFSDANFSRGWYVNLQNEIFCNLTNQQNVKNSWFDQNRLYGSVGFRWSKKLDTELGYMWWQQNEMDEDIATGVLQLMITTEL